MAIYCYKYGCKSIFSTQFYAIFGIAMKFDYYYSYYCDKVNISKLVIFYLSNITSTLVLLKDREYLAIT